MNLRGRNILNSLRILMTGIFTLENSISTKLVKTMKKSSYDHDSVRYEFSSMKNPKPIIFSVASQIKTAFMPISILALKSPT